MSNRQLRGGIRSLPVTHSMDFSGPCSQCLGSGHNTGLPHNPAHLLLLATEQPSPAVSSLEQRHAMDVALERHYGYGWHAGPQWHAGLTDVGPGGTALPLWSLGT